jgi:fructose-1,6-bisphosphatase-3
MARLSSAFMHSEKLQAHVQLLFDHGSMYLRYNGNLLFHGCIPLDEKGYSAKVGITGRSLSGRAYLDACEAMARQGFYEPEGSDQRRQGQDFMWYMWCGPKSPLFGKDKMTAFERYFIDDPATHKEQKDPYYRFNDQEEICRRILADFGLNPDTGHIINGHVPVLIRKGESPVKANGKLLVIDGGLSKAYQKQTGIAGYTLIYNSHGLFLASHESFESNARAIEDEEDIHSQLTLVEAAESRQMIRNTDLGAVNQQKIDELYQLISAYRLGLLRQHQAGPGNDTAPLRPRGWMDRM